MYLVFTCTPGESYHRQLRSLLLYLCYVFWALINSLVCWLRPDDGDMKVSNKLMLCFIFQASRNHHRWCTTDEPSRIPRHESFRDSSVYKACQQVDAVFHFSGVQKSPSLMHDRWAKQDSETWKLQRLQRLQSLPTLPQEMLTVHPNPATMELCQVMIRTVSSVHHLRMSPVSQARKLSRLLLRNGALCADV